MKRIGIVFLFLMSVFFITWGVKANTLVKRPNNIQDGKVLAWYESNYTSPISENEWEIPADVPDEYIKMPGSDDIYLETDLKTGKVKRYVKRLANGEFVDFNPNIPETYEKVEGQENVYKVTDKDGKVSYKKYIRNKDDNTFTFIDVDKDGKPLNQNVDATNIDDKHKLVDSKENLYAVYDKNNVKIGYQKRVKNKDGQYVWKNAKAPKKTNSVGNNALEKARQEAEKEIQQKQQASNPGNGLHVSDETEDDSGYQEETDEDGNFVETSVERTSKTKDGYKYIYETTTKVVKDKNGNIINIKKGDPVQISKVKVEGSDANPDPSAVAKTLDEELARVSSKVNYNTGLASQVLSLLNATRQEKGLSALKMDTGSDIYKIAQIRAADMAIFNNASNTSPVYGSTKDLCKKYNLNLVNVTHNMWKTDETSAEEINNRFANTTSSSQVVFSDGYGQVGIAIVEKDGMNYIIEVFAQ